jgi:hypothetical protein
VSRAMHVSVIRAVLGENVTYSDQYDWQYDRTSNHYKCLTIL